MKNSCIFFLLLASLLLPSCTTYYYLSVKSYENQLMANEDGSFTTSCNDISVTYSFKDLGGKVVYEIQNESDDPIFVDWSRSVLIAEDYAVQYKDNLARFGGNVSTVTYRFSGSDYVTSSGSVSGQIILPQNELFVPPHSKTVHSPMLLERVLDVQQFPQTVFDKRVEGASDVFFITFSEKDTPLKFRSYLTVVNDRDKSQTVFENTFFIAEIVKSSSQNPLLARDVKLRDDWFSIETVNKTSATLGWIAAGVAVLGGTIWLGGIQPEMPSIH